MTAADQLERIVALVAECSRRERRGEPYVPITELADQLDSTPQQLQADIRTLTHLGDDVEADWLLSLRVWQEGDRVALSSGGPFRRPVRLAPDELLAIQVGLATEDDPFDDLSRRFAALATSRTGVTANPPVRVERPNAEPDLVALMLRAIRERRRVEILYAGEGAKLGEARVIQPHQMVTANGRAYVVAWCETARGWRHFRADRVIDALLRYDTYEPRDDFQAIDDIRDVFMEPEGGTDQVEVRFASDIARWIRERYPDHRQEADGSVVVTFRVASIDWLIRHVLGYGDQAEVISPEAYREAMKRAVA